MPVRTVQTDACSCEHSSGYCGPCLVAECHCDSDGYAYCVESGCGASWQDFRDPTPRQQQNQGNRKGGRVSGVQRFASGGRAGRSRLGHPIRRN